MIFQTEHPKPQFMRESWMNLNGEWQFETDNDNDGRERELFADGVRIFAVHGHALPAGGTFPGLAAGSAQLSGHTHIPRAEGREGIHFWNPGSASLPKADFPRSYGVIENGAFSVFPLAGGAELMRDAVRCGA